MRTTSVLLGVFLGSFAVYACSSGTTSNSQAGLGGSTGRGGATGAGGGSASGGSSSKDGSSSSSDSQAKGGGSSSASKASDVGGSTASPAGSSTNAGGADSSGPGAQSGGAKTSSGSAVGPRAGAAAVGKGGAAAAGAPTATGTKAGGGAGPGTSAVVSNAGAKPLGGSGNAGGAPPAAGGAPAAAGTGEIGGCPELPAAPAPAANIVQFTDNGGWCWYQDERAIVDATGGKIVIGSVAGTGSIVGNIQATIYDLASKKATTTKLGNLSVDDHDAPAMALRPDGKYVAVWATHRSDCNTYYSIYDGSAWGAQKKYDWTQNGCRWNPSKEPPQMITYSNVWYMGDTLFDVARSADTSPNLLASSDDGATWKYYGRLTATEQVGYVAGYYKYWGDNKERIDFVATENHPRDNDNNLWHGYVQGDKIYDSTGKVVDDKLPGTTAPADAQNISKFTKVFATGTSLKDTTGKTVKLEHAWNHDIVRYDDGSIAILGQARVNGTGTDDPDKRAIYARFDGTKWNLTYLAKLGAKLYADEQDYTGLSALHPNNPNIIYLSTTFDPRDDTTKSTKHEIWQGVTCDKGATFKWAPITEKSTVDNVRPIVPKWDSSHTALLWLKGTYKSAQGYDFAVVGIISGQ